MDALLDNLERDFPNIKFEVGETFCWSPQKQAVLYIQSAKQPRGNWSLLHELSHALLGHQTYSSDFELLKMEVEAWHKAQALAGKYGLEISNEHVQKCLNTYRDWLHQRSTCPTCGNKSLQSDSKHYRCFNCGATWKVSASRFCRPYRLLHSAQAKEKPLAVQPQTAFREEA